MQYLYIAILLVLTQSLNAKVLTSPIDSMSNSFGADTEILKKNILINKTQAKAIRQDAKVKFRSKIFKVFRATKKGKIVGYGILLNRKVRSKNAVVLYIIDINANLKSIELIAFNEPMEYLPSQKWNSQFENMDTDKRVSVGKEIATITGATLSARTITDGSRLAFAFYNEVLKDK